MVYTYKELLGTLKIRNNINKKLKNKELFLIEKGIYSDSKVNDPLIIYSKKYHNSIITFDNAFYYYGLTDVTPSKYYLATKQKARPIKNDKIVQIFTTDEFLNLGKVEVFIDGNKVNMYNKERLLIELIRRRKQIPLDYYKEIINNYRKIIYDLSMKKIEEYASHFSTENHILETIQLEVL